VSLVGEPRVNHAVERDAVPGQLAVRFNKVPKASARLGRGVGGRHSAAGASGREDRCSEYAELGDGRPPCLNIDHPDLEKDSYKTHSNLSERFQILVASAPQRSCTAWQTGQADPRSKLRLWRELSKPKYKAFDLASALLPRKRRAYLNALSITTGVSK